MPKPKPKRPKPDKSLILTEADRKAVTQGCWFDRDAADFAVDFIEGFCTLTKGRTAGRKVKLLDWQRDLIRRLFGWKRRDGTRRFRSAYVEIPKKNGKSLLMSAIAILMVMADGESGAEVYLAAVNSKQARIVFNECMKMVACSPALKKRLRVRDTLKKIEYPATWSKIECVTADAESQDGFDSSCTIFDELHRQKNTKLWDVFEFAGSGREQPLLISITTAGQDKHSLCWTEHERARKILDGTSLDWTHLACIYAADRSDDLDDPKTWHKANPSLGHTLRVDDFKNALEKVKESPSGLNNFLRLRLNIWTDAETAYIAHDVWVRCGLDPIDIEALRGKPCYAGIDLSSKKDITALCLLFGDENEGFTVLPFFWIPETEAKLREREDSIPYTQWAREGLVTLSPGSAIDYDLIEAKIIELSKTFRILSITSDDWGSAEAVLQRVAKKGIKTAYMIQGFKSMTDPTKELERLAIIGKFKHAGNKVLTWMNGHAKVVSDAAANIKLEKPMHSSPKKIDGLIALIEALYTHTLARRAKPNAYSNRKVQVFTQ
jgi:phage terminase large subunit-like protein